MKIYTTEEPPLNYTDLKDKSYALDENVNGFTSDIVKEIIKRNTYNTQIALIPWARAYKYALNKENIFIYSMAKTKLRENLFKWVGPIALKKTILFKKSNSNLKIKSLDEAKNVDSIGIILEDAKYQYLKEKGFKNLLNTRSFETGLKLLVNNKISLWAQTDFDSPIIAKRANVDINRITSGFQMYNTVLYIGVSKNTNEELIQKWQKTLDEIKSDGTFKKIAQKWAKYFKMDWIVKDNMLQVNYNK